MRYAPMIVHNRHRNLMHSHLTRRSALGAFLALPGLAMRGTSAVAESAADYPSKPIRLIIPFLAGGAADIVARIVAQNLSDGFGQPVICDNRPGAGGNVGTELAAKTAPDGYTLLIQGNPLGSNVFLYKNVDYDPMKSFAPIAIHYRDYNVLIVHPSFPANSVRSSSRWPRRSLRH